MDATLKILDVGKRYSDPDGEIPIPMIVLHYLKIGGGGRSIEIIF
jgi:hypothetical protein